jgi:Gly-Xaa carboxypeptidase
LPSKDVHDTSKVWKEKEKIIKWHQGAIRVPTQVYDEMGAPGADDRWEIFQEFHDCKQPLFGEQAKEQLTDSDAVLEGAYPLV